MGYNIDSIKTPVLDAWMKASDVLRLHRKHEADLPEMCFLKEMLGAAENARKEGKARERRVEIVDFWWSHSWSGRSYRDVLIEKIAPHIMGTVEAIVCWEGGDSFTGLLIHDGKVVECKVEMRVAKPEGWQ